VTLKPAPFSARGLLDDVLGAVCAAMGAPPLAPRVCQDGALPRTVIADVDRVTRILQNASISLLRHAPRDDALSVRIACPLLLRSDGGADGDAGGAAAELRIDLVDDARHVAREEDFERMYAPYFTTSTPAHGGLHSGLGLCVARAFARAMGGSLIAERTSPLEPSGMAMRLRLPVRVPREGQATMQLYGANDSALPGKSDSTLLRALHRSGGGVLAAGGAATLAANGDAADDARQQTDKGAAQLRVLLVEDHDLIRKLVSTLLRSAGFAVTTAVHGADALAQLQAAAGTGGGGALPDAVLCDLQMPIMCGHSFARAFRAWEEAVRAPLGAPRLRIIALSANVLDEHVSQSLAAGMDAHWAKPLAAQTVHELRAQLQRGGAARFAEQ
jgi:CheY-like chemotaxis protein